MVTRTSRKPHSPSTRPWYSMAAIRIPPTPSVVALVGPCRRRKKSENRTNPIEPTSEKNPPTSSVDEIASSVKVMFIR